MHTLLTAVTVRSFIQLNSKHYQLLIFRESLTHQHADTVLCDPSWCKLQHISLKVPADKCYSVFLSKPHNILTGDVFSISVKRHHDIGCRSNNIFQVHEKEVKKYSAGAQMVKLWNNFLILENFSVNSGFF